MTHDNPIRKQVYELTHDDLAVHPAWEFCLDEEDRPGQDEATVQPIIVTDRGQVEFWLGLVDGRAAAAERARLYDLLAAEPEAFFPVSYRPEAGWSRWPGEGAVMGFGRYRQRFLRGTAKVTER
jgi:hypothetical protein